MWGRFIRQTLVFTFIILLILAGINRIADPYNIYSNTIDYSKNTIGTHLRLFKAIAIRKQTADILLCGDSRIEHGIDPAVLKKITNQSIFNASLVSMRIYELRKYLELALQYHKPKSIVLGLQLYTFRGDRKYVGDYDEKYLEKKYTPYTIVLSKDMLTDSIKSMKQMHNNIQPERDQNGLAHYVLEKTAHARFLANEKEYLLKVAPELKHFRYGDGSSAFDEYAKILRLCHENNITLILFISPSHARQREAEIIGNGLESLEYWEKELVYINEQIAKEKGRTPFELWDFYGYHALTTEAVPTQSYTMKYYYESSHFTPALGNIILDRIFDSNVSGGGNYRDFGLKLTPQNIETHLANLRRERVKWQASHRLDITEIEALKNQR